MSEISGPSGMKRKINDEERDTTQSPAKRLCKNNTFMSAVNQSADIFNEG